MTNRKFTLIELLIIIAAIGILMTLLMPSLRDARLKAYTATCLKNLNTIATSSIIYSSTNNGELGYDTSLTSWSVNNHNYGLPVTTKNMLQDYFGVKATYHIERENRQGILLCPGYTDSNDYRQKSPFVAHDGSTPTNVNNNSKHIRTYRLNDWIADIPTTHNWNSTAKDKPLARLSEVRDASMMILSTESFGKNLMINFAELYYNPSHGHKAVVDMVDGSARLLKFDAGKPGWIWAPNGANSQYAVESWGSYLHPSYNLSY